MEDVLNWKEIFKKSQNFKEQSPTKWTYIENFFSKELYDELYKTYPIYDETWKSEDSYDKIAYRKYWGKVDKDKNLTQEQDLSYSDSWNKLLKYFHFEH